MDRKWWTLIAVCVGTFMLLLDVTIVNVALPAIQSSLNASFSDLQWVVDAYSLLLAALLLTTGSLADLYGRKRVFVIGLVIFILSSLASGLAQSPLWLNLARGAQGIGGAAMFSTSLALLGAFLALENRLANPIMPLRILRLRMLMGSSLVRGLLITGMFSAFFLGSLYLERVLGYNAIDTGLAFMPLTISIGVMSAGVSARVAQRFGPLNLLAVGLLGIVAGLLLLTAQGLHAAYFPGLFFAFLLLGLGAGASFLPLLTIGMSDAPARDAGLASGIINVSVQLFGAIGLASLGTIATDHAKALSASGHTLSQALTGGYHLAYLVAAVCVAVGIVAAFVVLRPPSASVGQLIEEEEQRLAEGVGSAQPVAQAA